MKNIFTRVFVACRFQAVGSGFHKDAMYIIFALHSVSLPLQTAFHQHICQDFCNIHFIRLCISMDVWCICHMVFTFDMIFCSVSRKTFTAFFFLLCVCVYVLVCMSYSHLSCYLKGEGVCVIVSGVMIPNLQRQKINSTQTWHTYVAVRLNIKRLLVVAFILHVFWSGKADGRRATVFMHRM